MKRGWRLRSRVLPLYRQESPLFLSLRLILSGPSIVSIFTINRTLDQGAIDLINKWQYIAFQMDPDMFLEADIMPNINQMDSRFHVENVLQPFLEPDHRFRYRFAYYPD